MSKFLFQRKAILFFLFFIYNIKVDFWVDQFIYLVDQILEAAPLKTKVLQLFISHLTNHLRKVWYAVYYWRTGWVA